MRKSVHQIQTSMGMHQPILSLSLLWCHQRIKAEWGLLITLTPIQYFWEWKKYTNLNHFVWFTLFSKNSAQNVTKMEIIQAQSSYGICGTRTAKAIIGLFTLFCFAPKVTLIQHRAPTSCSTSSKNSMNITMELSIICFSFLSYRYKLKRNVYIPTSHETTWQAWLCNISYGEGNWRPQIKRFGTSLIYRLCLMIQRLLNEFGVSNEREDWMVHS